jgi:predicted enzyme related to lactoylglutathione lyase
MDPIVHFELPAGDLDEAKKFYGPIFGWKLQDWPMPDGSNYVGVHTTPIDEKTREPLKPGGINGGIMKKNDHVKNVHGAVVAIKVASIDEKIAMIEKSGGKVVMPKMDMMGMGFYAYFSDPSGNVVGLWEDAPKK